MSGLDNFTTSGFSSAKLNIGPISGGGSVISAFICLHLWLFWVVTTKGLGWHRADKSGTIPT